MRARAWNGRRIGRSGGLLRLAGSTVGSAVLLLSVATGTVHAQGGSSVQCIDGGTLLISKDVGPDRWAISYRRSDGLTAGNVYSQDGGAIFLSCRREGIREGNVQLSCGTSLGCSADECPAFEPIAEPVSVPCTFFTAPCSKTPSSSASAATCSGSPARAPYDSEASCIAFADKNGCYEREYSPGRCAVRYCCSSPSCSDP